MNILLWIFQSALALLAFAGGAYKLFMFDELAKLPATAVLVAFEPSPLPIHVVYPHARLLSSNVRRFVDWAVPRLRARLKLARA